MQIEIDECVYWILHTVVSNDLLKYNHVTVGEENLEFIVVEAKNYFIDLTGLTKIEKICKPSVWKEDILCSQQIPLSLQEHQNIIDLVKKYINQ